MNGQWNVPDRHDWYSMQVANEVRRALSKNPNAYQTGGMKLEFQEIKEQPKQAISDDEAMRRSQATWLGATGANSKKLPVVKKPDEPKQAKRKRK